MDSFFLAKQGGLNMVEKKNYNHLKGEKSPYLIQHRDNPVDWYPWGEEAFRKARNENKPIFLSIGYSTCHWCHVMARESFQDPDMARLINQVFIPVKVDREELPDVDSTYMAACQIMTGQGGWPLTVLLTPDLKPIFAGTYFPKDDSDLSVGLRTIILNLKDLWNQNKNELIKSAEDITNTLNSLSSTKSGEVIPKSTLTQAYNILNKNFDEQQGGFGTSQKFPSPNILLFLLRYWDETRDEDALEMVEKTLTYMAQGGIWDHIGYGFHRYSVDPGWLIPHFEKMLYDQALLVIVYTEAYQATQKLEYRMIASQILEYVLRDMTSEEGGFYSAEDAESEGVEGKFYLWRKEEIEKILNPEESELFNRIYHVKTGGNYFDDITGQYNGNNILHMKKPLLKTDVNTEEKELSDKLDNIKMKIFQARNKRVHPSKDDKILTDWNGLMIAALARAGRVYDEPKYVDAARDAICFIKDKLYPDGKLMHRYRDGDVKVEGYLEDYAYLIWGLLEFYETTMDSQWLQWAYELNQIVCNKFQDRENGGFYQTSKDTPRVLIRKKDVHDSVLPSGNAVTLLNLEQLSALLENQNLNETAIKLEKAFSPLVNQTPTAHLIFLIGIINSMGPYFEVVIATEKQEEAREFLEIFNQNYLPRTVYSLNTQDEEWLKEKVETFKDKQPVDDKTTAYICKQGVCGLPVTDRMRLLELLK